MALFRPALIGLRPIFKNGLIRAVFKRADKVVKIILNTIILDTNVSTINILAIL